MEYFKYPVFIAEHKQIITLASGGFKETYEIRFLIRGKFVVQDAANPVIRGIVSFQG